MNFAIASPTTPSALAVTAPATAAASLQHKKLTEAAQQFEGMLMQELLKPMKERGFCQDEAESDGKDEGSGFGDTMSSYGTETMATAVAKGGGLGIAKRVVAQVEQQKAAHHAAGAISAQPRK